MSLRIIRGGDKAPTTPLSQARVAVLGYGNQGRAHALNMRDSGLEVVIGGRPGRGLAQAVEDGFTTHALAEAVALGDLVVLALPDEVHAAVYAADVGPHLRSGCTIGFLHGFSIRYGLVTPPADVGVVMVAPKGPGAALRARFEEGHGLACLFAVHQESPSGDAEPRGLAWASAIGGARAGIIHTTFSDETETDLFGEQSVLCGGLTALIVAAFETLVDEGYPPELAYIECCQEVKQIADLVFERGIAGMTAAISNTAEFGAYRAGPALVDDEVRTRMRRILGEIRDGTFARAMRDDYDRGFPWFRERRDATAEHPIEAAGRVVRDLTVPGRGDDAHSPGADGR